MAAPQPLAPAAPIRPTPALLEVRELKVYFAGEEGESRAVDGVSLALEPGRTLGLVGESGCGKSVTSLAIMGLVPSPPGRIAGGEVIFAGVDLLKLPSAELSELRGNRLSMIFQEPMTSLNPAFTVGEQIAEAIERHKKVGRKEARERAILMMRRVRIPAAEARYDDYPHKLSGGMRQRVMIAMALACDPALLIADEPTTALDVTIQAQILDLMRELHADFGTAIIMISHDLGVIAEIANEVAVMYAGKIVELAPVKALFAEPQHPYTIGLLGALPKLHHDKARLATIEGAVPSLIAPPEGCPFHPRCPFADAECRAVEPALEPQGGGHFAACLKAPLDGGR